MVCFSLWMFLTSPWWITTLPLSCLSPQMKPIQLYGTPCLHHEVVWWKRPDVTFPPWIEKGICQDLCLLLSLNFLCNNTRRITFYETQFQIGPDRGNEYSWLTRAEEPQKCSWESLRNATLLVAPQTRSWNWAVSSLIQLQMSRLAACYRTCEAFDSCTDLLNVPTACWVA